MIHAIFAAIGSDLGSYVTMAGTFAMWLRLEHRLTKLETLASVKDSEK